MTKSPFVHSNYPQNVSLYMALFRGFAKKTKFQKSEITMGPGLNHYFVVENRPKIALNQY